MFKHIFWYETLDTEYHTGILDRQKSILHFKKSKYETMGVN